MAGSTAIPQGVIDRVKSEINYFVNVCTGKTYVTTVKKAEDTLNLLGWRSYTRYPSAAYTPKMAAIYNCYFHVSSGLGIKQLLIDSGHSADFYLQFISAGLSLTIDGVPIARHITKNHQQPAGIYDNLALSAEQIDTLVQYRKLVKDKNWLKVHTTLRVDTAEAPIIKSSEDFNLSALAAYPFQYMAACQEISHGGHRNTVNYNGLVLATPYSTTQNLLSQPYLDQLQKGDQGQYLPLLTLVGAPDIIELYKNGTLSYEQEDRFGNNPLHLMAMNGDIHSLRQAVQAGADINMPNINGATPLHFFVENLCLTNHRPKRIKLNESVFRFRP